MSSPRYQTRSNPFFLLSSTTIAKLSKGESVTTDTILRICERFDVQPGDIMEYVPDEDQS